MKKIIALLALISSFTVFAGESTSSVDVNKNFVLSEAQIESFAEAVYGLTTEELGDFTGYQCSSEGVAINCQFNYDLPEDYCWYGSFVADVKIELTDNGPEMVESSVEWID